MASNDYHFITRWRVVGTVEEVSDILADPLELVRWWPSVYLGVNCVRPGDERGVGGVYDLYTKGWLPYTLNWRFQTVEAHTPHGFTIEARGDFVGRGIWTFAQSGHWVDITYDWRIRANKPLLRYLSFLLKPIFAANHRWAMARGEESLRLELARRRAATLMERARIPAPPRPTSSWPWSAPVLAGMGVGILAAGFDVWMHPAARMRSRRAGRFDKGGGGVIPYA